MDKILQNTSEAENKRKMRKLGWKMFIISVIIFLFIGPLFLPVAFFSGAFAIGGIIIIITNINTKNIKIRPLTQEEMKTDPVYTDSMTWHWADDD